MAKKKEEALVIVAAPAPRRKSGALSGRLKKVQDDFANYRKGAMQRLRKGKEMGKKVGRRAIRGGLAYGTGYALGKYEGGFEVRGEELPTIGESEWTYSDAATAAVAAVAVTGLGRKINPEVEAVANSLLGIKGYQAGMRAAKADALADELEE